MKEPSERRHAVYRALLEMSFIVFLFYSNLLMGQYNAGHSFSDRPLLVACKNIITFDNFIVGVIAAFFGHVAFDNIRNRL